jgi:hypothetical protein
VVEPFPEVERVEGDEEPTTTRVVGVDEGNVVEVVVVEATAGRVVVAAEGRLVEVVLEATTGRVVVVGGVDVVVVVEVILIAPGTR